MKNLPRLAFKAHTAYNLARYGHKTRYGVLHAEAVEAAPRSILEIGVWRGERSLELIRAALINHPASDLGYWGLDLFEQMPTDLVVLEASRSRENPTRQEVLGVLQPHIDAGVDVRLIAGNTLETLPALADSGITCDFAFIDGGHSYDTVLSDWTCVSQMLTPGGTAIFDDYVNTAAMRHEAWGTNEVIDAIDRRHYEVTLLSPVDWWEHEWGLFKNRLVRVKRR